MAAVRAFAGRWFHHGDWLIDSTAWRWQIAEAGRRQCAGRSGYRDADLLDRACFVRFACGIILLYGESGLLVTATEAPGLLRRLEEYQRTALRKCRPLRAADEFVIVATLRHDLRRLLQLNRRPDDTPNPQYDDGRADQARPSRSPLNPNPAWPPASGRRMTPCPRV